MKNKHKIVTLVAGVIAVGSVIAPSFAFAQVSDSRMNSSSVNDHNDSMGKSLFKNRMHVGRGINGKVISVSGSIITLCKQKKRNIHC